MNEFNILLESLNKRILFSTNSKKVQNYIAYDFHPRSHIAELNTYIKDYSDSDFLVCYNLGNKKDIKFDLVNKKVDINCYDHDIEETELTFLLVFLFENLYQRGNIYSMHSAGIVKDDESIILIADSMGGKTLLSTYVCQKNKYKMIGDDRITFKQKDNSIYSLGGNVIISPRISTLPLLSFKNKSFDNYSESSVIKIHPNELGIERSLGEHKVKAICRIHISNYNEVFRDISPFDKQLLAYIKMSEDIKATGYSFINLEYPFPLFVDENIEKQRLKFSTLFKDIPGYYIYGGLKFIYNKLTNIISGNIE